MKLHWPNVRSESLLRSFPTRARDSPTRSSSNLQSGDVSSNLIPPVYQLDTCPPWFSDPRRRTPLVQRSRPEYRLSTRARAEHVNPSLRRFPQPRSLLR
jgi:hypothetical protein